MFVGTFYQDTDVAMILSSPNTIQLCTALNTHTHTKQMQWMIKQNGNKRTRDGKKLIRTCAQRWYIYMQKCRSCHQNNTNSSINMIIVAFYYDFSDTILTARPIHANIYTTHTNTHTVDNDIALCYRPRSLTSSPWRSNVSNTHTELMFGFSFLYASAMCRTIPIPLNGTHVSDRSALHIDYECLCDKLARKQYSLK